jgi:hypothetical protein
MAYKYFIRYVNIMYLFVCEIVCLCVCILVSLSVSICLSEYVSVCFDERGAGGWYGLQVSSPVQRLMSSCV